MEVLCLCWLLCLCTCVREGLGSDGTVVFPVNPLGLEETHGSVMEALRV